MKFLVHAQVDQGSIKKRLGSADYSYYFLLRAFSDVLSDLGEVIPLSDPTQASEIYARCQEEGEPCVLLSFAPPHKTPLGLACPTVPVFAWEYPNIPECIQEASWMHDPRNDWRYVFHRTGRAIALSTHTVDAVQRSMGAQYPVVAIPSPMRTTHRLATGRQPCGPASMTTLRVHGRVVDSACMRLDPEALINPVDEDGTVFRSDDFQHLADGSSGLTAPLGMDWTRTLAAKSENDPSVLEPDEQWPVDCGWDLPQLAATRLDLRGVVYAAVLTPEVGRKNWMDLITAFCWTFRDTPEATLVLKIAGTDLLLYHRQLIMLLTKLSPMKCRVIAIQGYISDEDYQALISATTYYVNTSLCEGLCLPLVEFLSAGIPAIAPNNTAMADYISDDIAFVVASYPGLPTVWPHGDLEVTCTSTHQLDWQSLASAYQRSFDVASEQPQRYADMSIRANGAMHSYCGTETVKRQLQRFLCPDIALQGVGHGEALVLNEIVDS